jgi:ribosomal protein L21E
MTVSAERRGTERVLVVDGDLACPATLVQLRAALNAFAYGTAAPVVVDLSAATGSSPAIDRLLGRVGTVLAHRGVSFHVLTRELSAAQ